MAATGVMADFARLPTSRKALVFVVIGVLGGLLYWQFVYKSLERDLETAENDNKAKAAMNKKLAEDIPKYEELKSRMKELTAIITENQKALPTEAEVPAFFETLGRKITESGVEIRKWKKLPESPVESFVRVPVEIEVTGSFMQIKRFMASLTQRGVMPTSDSGVEERERIISIEGLQLINPVVRNRELAMTAKFVAVTFRQEDGSAPAAAPAKGAAPAGPAGVPATAPMPSTGTGTPAGAKSSVEGSLDKADKVDRNAAGVDEAKTPAAGSNEKLKGGM
ncbi:MAG: type 4a pilus biogenesis protein PilO [Deltaproteobacteria bacterium]|nr:type 4a pilus biogenesis protein PilO [Deltaproteobacteria bacterium]